MRLAAFGMGFAEGLQAKRDQDERAEMKKDRAAARERGMTGTPFAPETGGEFKIDAGGDAASLIRQFEGYRDSPYWDVNAYRVGYGSDTITGADGRVQRVEKGMKINRADADRDLARRTQEFASRARGQAGDAWGNLSPQATAALTSIAYNYGSLPERILPAVQSGDHEAIATAIEGLGGDNDGINRKRRAQEAAIVRSGADPRVYTLAASRYRARTGRGIDDDLAAAAAASPAPPAPWGSIRRHQAA